jgi:DNA polymerase I
MKFDIQEINKHCSASDTDSAFLVLEPLLKKRYPDLDLNNADEVLPKIKPIQKELGEILNSAQTPITKMITNVDQHYFDLKPEFIVQKAYWSGKRRYAQYLVDREGNRIEKLVMMGLDIVKSNFPPFFRNFGEELLKRILFGNSKENIDKFVLDFKNSLVNVEWKKLLKPTGIKKLDFYIESAPKDNEIFSKLKLKCPINTKAAIISNDLLRHHNLQDKYPEFTIGDKIYIAKLKSNPYHIEVVALNGYNDSPPILELVEKYIDREGLFDSVLKNKINTIYEDIGWGQANFNPYVSQFFSFD